MSDDHARLERELTALKETVAGLAARVEALEAGAIEAPAPGAPPVDASAAAAGEADGTTASPVTFGAVIALLGRSCLVFCGAFLLRGMTDSGTVPVGLGIGLGLAYAALWLVASERAATKGAALSAEFHGVAAVLIGFPLLVEATHTFKVLGPVTSPLLLIGLTAFGLTVAWVRRLQVLAWTVSLGSVATSIALIRLTFHNELYATSLLALGVATAWIAYKRDWHGIRWFTALAVDLIILNMADLAARPGGPPFPFETLSVAATIALSLALFVLYITSFSIRTLLRHRNVSAFEVVQSVAVFLVGFGGAARIATATGSGTLTFGIASVVLGCLNYAVAFASVDRRLGRGTNFFFFTTLGILLMLDGTWRVSSDGLAPLLWCGLALAAAIVGGRFDRITLRAHAAAYVVAAALASGLAAAAGSSFLKPTVERRLGGIAMVVIVIAVVVYLILAATQRNLPPTWRSRLPRFCVALVIVTGLGTLVIGACNSLFSLQTLHPGWLDSTRSLVLAVAALALAGISRAKGFQELKWLVTPILIVGGVKLVFLDLPAGTPSTLFLAFASYGIALIVAPRWMKAAAPTVDSP